MIYPVRIMVFGLFVTSNIYLKLYFAFKNALCTLKRLKSKEIFTLNTLLNVVYKLDSQRGIQDPNVGMRHI